MTHERDGLEDLVKLSTVERRVVGVLEPTRGGVDVARLQHLAPPTAAQHTDEVLPVHARLVVIDELVHIVLLRLLVLQQLRERHVNEGGVN